MRRESTGPMPGKCAHSSAVARLMSNRRVGLNTDTRRDSPLDFGSTWPLWVRSFQTDVLLREEWYASMSSNQQRSDATVA